MRLGAQDVRLAPGSRARALYGRDVIRERHRHRYEFNNGYLDRYRDGGMALAGFSPDGLVEIVELTAHPWFLATQFHPEFTSNPRDGHPLFTGFLAAARSHHDAAVARSAGAGAATVTTGRA
jgi:CTP synthase